MIPPKQIPKKTRKKEMDNFSNDPDDYLERKYGKEPKISSDELRRIQWNWH